MLRIITFIVALQLSFGLEPCLAQGSSPKYEVTGIPICWKKDGVDSNLVRYTLLSPSSGQPKALFYINSLGAAINPAGGILKMGWCCNCSGGSGSEFTPLASNGLNMDGDTTQLGGTLNQNTSVELNGKKLLFRGSRFNEGLKLEDDIDNYLIGTGNGSTTEDAYANFYRDVSGFGRMTLAAYQILIGVPAGNGYHLPSTRPGGNPTSFPTGTRWFPVWDRTGSGTGTSAGWYEVPQERTGVVTASTDANGDISVTFATALPDNTYLALATPEANTRYQISVHSKTSSGFKVNAAAGAGTAVTINYQAKDL